MEKLRVTEVMPHSERDARLDTIDTIRQLVEARIDSYDEYIAGGLTHYERGRYSAWRAMLTMLDRYEHGNNHE